MWILKKQKKNVQTRRRFFFLLFFSITFADPLTDPRSLWLVHFETVAFNTSIWLRVTAKNKKISHRLQIAFIYMKQRTLHVPVVWPSAPYTRDITTVTAQAKPSRILHTDFAADYALYIFFLFYKLYNIHLLETWAQRNKKNIYIYAPKTQICIIICTQVFIDATNAKCSSSV